MGLNYDLVDKSENLRRMKHFKNLIKLIDFVLAENAGFFEFHVRILALKIENNLI